VAAAAQFQRYLRQQARSGREAVALPPFTLFLHPGSEADESSYAIPDAPPAGDLGEALAALCAAFARHGRRPRVEFVAEYAPGLGAALRAAGFAEVARQDLLACTPESFRPAEPVPGLTVDILDATSPAAALREGFETNAVAFDGPGAAPAADEAVERWRRELVEGRAFTARLDGLAAGAGMLTGPLDGLAELVGVGTLAPFRRRGVASALTSTAVQTAFERGLCVVFLTTDDPGARRVYERVGFRPTATVLAYAGPR
jgi:ribosomal protein S18 acetylase RimI-like enzyme